MKNLLVINGPNLNLLGEREKGVYGTSSYESVCEEIRGWADDAGFDSCEIVQSNHEGAIIDLLHEARKDKSGVILNAGAYTHYSYAIRDAIASVDIPVVEVHISNIYNREEFRSHSVIAPVCAGHICGFGTDGYRLAITGIFNIAVPR